MSGGRMLEPLKTTNDHIKRPSRRFRSQMQFRNENFSRLLDSINMLSKQRPCRIRFSNALPRLPPDYFSDPTLMRRRRGTSSSGGSSTLPRITCAMPALVCESR
jgi:hypothetical protein